MKPTLNKKYCIGTHVMFYEIEMFTDYINGLINMLETIDNKENVMFDFYLNTNEHLEQIDTSKILKDDIVNKFLAEMGRLSKVASSPFSGISVTEKCFFIPITDVIQQFYHNF